MCLPPVQIGNIVVYTSVRLYHTPREIIVPV
jgi:hypothetical protein